MKTISPALLAHYAQGVTTIARCWKCTRVDGAVFGFTSVDQDIVVDGVTYKAATGFGASAMEEELDLAVPNLELVGVLDSDAISEEDILVGRWDGAAVEIFEVNYQDLTQGVLLLRAGVLGKISAGAASFNAEGRGLAQFLQQSIGRIFGAACDATLGDARCKLDLAPYTVAGTVDLLLDRRIFGDTGRTEAEAWFGSGVITWLTGANEGLRMEIAQFHIGGGFVLHLAMPYDIQIGDTYSAVPGCSKREQEDCKTKFNNIVNFRGFNTIPGNDRVLGTATVSEVP